MTRGFVALLLLAAVSADARGRFERFCGRTTQGRTERGLPCGDSAPAFEFASADGGGMGTACACAPVQSNQGVTITWGRASTALCSTKGNTLTGIAPGDIVLCAVDAPRVEPDDDGYLGVRIENEDTNLILRAIEFDDAVWSATATVTPDTDVAPDGTTTADTLEDTSAGSSEGISQTFVESGAKGYANQVFAKAGTLDAIRVVMTGAGGGSATCTITSLSSTTWTLARCPAGLTDDVTFEILVGAADADEGTVKVWLADSKITDNSVGSRHSTSPIITEGTAVTRAKDTNALPSGLPMVPSSWAANLSGTRSIEGPAPFGAAQYWVASNSTYIRGYCNAPATVTSADRDSATITNTTANCLSTGRVAARYSGQGASASVQICTGGVCAAATTGTSTTAAAGTASNIGYNAVNGWAIDGIMSRVCADPDTSRCTP